MPRPKRYEDGSRVSVWIPKRYRKVWDEIENKSAFVQLTLDDIVGIMTWAILKKEDPAKYHTSIDEKPIAEVLPDFNRLYPLDPLTQKRIDKQKHIEDEKKKEKPWNDTSPNLRNVL
jgi:hypothetical protein